MSALGIEAVIATRHAIKIAKLHKNAVGRNNNPFSTVRKGGADRCKIIATPNSSVVSNVAGTLMYVTTSPFVTIAGRGV
jgi:hypothetical protein